jgi:cytochrome c oxidase assembly factor 5
MKQRHTAAECLRSPLVEELPTRCQQLKKGFGECRRGMVDMRKRFRGNQPASFAQLLDAEKSGEGYQLYAGKSAFAGGRGETDGTGKPERDWREVENERLRAELAALQGKK